MSTDVILVGGGLANGLIAYRLSQRRPELRLTIVEQDSRLGGNHLWSFHDSDLSEAQHAWVGPLVTQRWPRHRVRFPAHRRSLHSGYNSIASQQLDRVVRDALADHTVLTDTSVASIGPAAIRLASGQQIKAPLVIDGRGAEPSRALALAYQKFLGLHVELEQAHGLDQPILMDATVEQHDGFRFIYTLPLGERSLLIEDTRYADGPTLSRDVMRGEIHAYAGRAGWTIRTVLREEEGILPIALAGDIDAYWDEGLHGVPRAGLRAALFHPTTGYSLPDAVRLADDIASMSPARSEEVYGLVRRRSVHQWKTHRFFRLLNRMLFHAALPEERYKVLQRFYRLPEHLIQRFYAGRPSTPDRLRILIGRPPVPLRRALACLSESSVWPGESARGNP